MIHHKLVHDIWCDGLVVDNVSNLSEHLGLMLFDLPAVFAHLAQSACELADELLGSRISFVDVVDDLDFKSFFSCECLGKGDLAQRLDWKCCPTDCAVGRWRRQPHLELREADLALAFRHDPKVEAKRKDKPACISMPIDYRQGWDRKRHETKKHLLELRSGDQKVCNIRSPEHHVEAEREPCVASADGDQHSWAFTGFDLIEVLVEDFNRIVVKRVVTIVHHKVIDMLIFDQTIARVLLRLNLGKHLLQRQAH